MVLMAAFISTSSQTPNAVYSTEENILYLQNRFDFMFQNLPPYYPTALVPNIWEKAALYKPAISNTCLRFFEQDHEGIKTLGFRFGDVTYSTDMVNLEQAAIDVLRGVKVWVADGNNFYIDTAGPHANRAILDRLNARIGAENVYITHMKNNLDYQTLKRDLPPGYRAAFDGLKIQLDGTILNDDASQ